MRLRALCVGMILVAGAAGCSGADTTASDQPADLPAPPRASADDSEMVVVEEGEIGIPPDSIMSEDEARTLYRDTIAEVEAELGDLPIDDQVPSGEFMTDRYSIEAEALSEAQDALWDRQETETEKLDAFFDRFSEESNANDVRCDEQFPDLGDGWDDCYNAGVDAYNANLEKYERRQDRMTKRHDEENDWLTARMERMYQESIESGDYQP